MEAAVAAPAAAAAAAASDTSAADAANPTAAASEAPAAGAASVLVTLLNLGGRTCELAPLPLSMLVSELAVIVRERFGTPVCSQKLIFGPSMLTDASLSLGDVFQGDTHVELTVCRRTLTPEEQGELNQGLVRAVGSGAMAQAREMLSEGAEVQPEQDSEIPKEYFCGGITALMMARAIGNEELVADFKSRGAEEPDMVAKADVGLGEAFQYQDFPEVVRLVAAGADVDMKLKRGQGIRATAWGVPLHACCACRAPGVLEVARLLIQKGAALQKGDAEGDTPLSHAKYFDNKEMFDVLKGQGAEVSGPFYRMFGRD